jgi:hypothetical protein
MREDIERAGLHFTSAGCAIKAFTFAMQNIAKELSSRPLVYRNSIQTLRVSFDVELWKLVPIAKLQRILGDDGQGTRA